MEMIGFQSLTFMIATFGKIPAFYSPFPTWLFAQITAKSFPKRSSIAPVLIIPCIPIEDPVRYFTAHLLSICLNQIICTSLAALVQQEGFNKQLLKDSIFMQVCSLTYLSHPPP